MFFMTTFIFLFFILALFIGSIFLQIHLSKKEGKWFGLILPILSFLISLLALFGSMLYQSETTSMQTMDEHGNVVYRDRNHKQSNQNSSFIGSISIFVLYNIPTVTYLCIYSNQKKRHSAKQQIHKMNIQDI